MRTILGLHKFCFTVMTLCFTMHQDFVFFLFLLCLILFCWLSDLESVVVSAPKPKEKPPLSVVGDVGGRIAIIVVSGVGLK